MRGCFVAFVAAAGCNSLFGLDPVQRSDGASPPGDGAVDSPAIDANSNDRDGDGIPNGGDNCPDVPNVLQRDFDQDGRGDRCDGCPHDPGPFTSNTDGDGVDDACDYDRTTRQCIAWFDPFDGDSSGAYELGINTGSGAWAIRGGALVQDDAGAADAALLTVASFRDPWVRTAGDVLTLLPTGTDAGITVDAHAVGLWVHSTREATSLTPNGCLGEVSQLANVSGSRVAVRRSIGGTVTTLAADLQNCGAMSAGSHVELEAVGTVTAAAAAALVNGVRRETSVDGNFCASLGTRVGLRTRFARFSFDYLLVTDVDPTHCPATGPCACPPPPER